MSVHTIATVLSRCAERKYDGRTYKGVLKTVDEAEAAVHAGESFFVTASSAAMSATEIMGIHFLTPATKRMHYSAVFSGSGAVVTHLIENPTIANTSKVAMTEFNADRDSTKAATLVASRISSTDVSVGTTLAVQVLGGGHQGRDAGAANTAAGGIMLKQSEDYAILINSDAAANNLAYFGSWIEEDS